MPTKLKYVYRKGETPEERLRNLIQPLFALIDVAEGKNFKLSPADQVQLIANCKNVKGDIKLILDDISVFYTLNPDVLEVEVEQSKDFKDGSNKL